MSNKINGQPALTTSQIGSLLGFQVSGIFIEETLGVAPDYKTNNTKMWLENKMGFICYQLSQHVFGVGEDFTENLKG